jgi:photosystem II stability/assembly factor-like uncharacterized protein
VSVQDEYTTNSAKFQLLIQSVIDAHPGRWYTGTAIPHLGDVRGKMVLLDRSGWVSYGIQRSSFEEQNRWDNGGDHETGYVRRDAKFYIIEDFLKKTQRGLQPSDKLLLNWWNHQANWPYTIEFYAAGINEWMPNYWNDSRVGEYGLQNYPRGIQIMDFFTQNNVRNVISYSVNKSYYQEDPSLPFGTAPYNWIKATHGSPLATTANTIGISRNYDGSLVAFSDHASASTDGKTWKKISTTFDGAVRNLFTFDSKLWAVGSGDQSSNLKYSTNGVYWTDVTDDWTKRSIADMTDTIENYNQRLIAVGDEIRIAFHVTDITTDTWSKANSTPKYPLNAISKGVYLFAVGGSPGIPYMLHSTSNTTIWNEVDVSAVFQGAAILDITHGGDRFVAVGEHGKMAEYIDSSDTIYTDSSGMWKMIYNTTFTANENINTVCYDDDKGVFLMAGDNGKINYYKPELGTTDQKVYAAEQISGVTSFDQSYYTNGKFILSGRVGSTREIFYAGQKGEQAPAPETDPPDPELLYNWIQATHGSPLTTNADTMGIAYGSNRFIAFSDHAVGSYDGKTWNRASPTIIDAAVRNLCYAGNRYWAVGSWDQDSNLKYSTDGQNWINVASDWTKHLIADITYSSNTFVTVGNETTNHPICYSADGITWTKAVITPRYPLNTVAGGGNTFIAAGGSSETTPYMLRSTDLGVTWTEVDVGSVFPGAAILDVAFGYNTTWVAVGQRGKMAVSTNDGQTWTAISGSSFTAAQSINTVCYDPDKQMFLMAGRGPQVSYYSAQSIPPVVSLNDVLGDSNLNTTFIQSYYADGKFILVRGNISAGSGLEIFYTGQKGEQAPSPVIDPPDPGLIEPVKYSWGESSRVFAFKGHYNGPIAWVVDAGSIIDRFITGGVHQVTSTNGSSWLTNNNYDVYIFDEGVMETLIYVSAISHSFRPIQKLFAGGSGDTYNLKASIDGLTWTNVISDWTKHSIADIVCNSGYEALKFYTEFVTVGTKDGSPLICYSADGNTWTRAAINPKYPLNAVAAKSNSSAFSNNSVIIAVGGSSGTPYMLRSADGGVNWTEVNVSSVFQGAAILDITYGGDRLVAVGEHGKMAMSTNNGQTWTAISGSAFTADENINVVCYDSVKEVFLMAGDNGKINYYQPKLPKHAADVYTSDQIPDSGSFKYAAYANGRFVLTTAEHNTADRSRIYYSVNQ